VDDNIPISILSDVHAGEVVDPKQVFGLNEYSMTIMQERLSMYVNNIFWLLEEHLSPREYSGFVFCLGGDMIAGDIHQELSETNEQQVMPVLLDLYQNLKYVIEILADKFGKLFIPCVYGNHGRTNKKPQHKSQAYKNFDWLLYHLLADSFQEDSRVNFLIGDDDEVQFKVANTVYRLTHGAQLTGGSGFIGPLAPITRGEKKKNIVAQTQSLPYDVLLMGHFHQTLWMPRTVVNGSLVGYSEYAADKNLEYEPPKQMLWLTDPSFGKVSPMEVYCDNARTQAQSLKQVVF
jgi:predicted phosphodiesterase